jgi:alanyl-tRNA synthetase
MQSSELRQKYLEFFKQKGHSIIPSASLIPENDSTTLFTGSGMQPMVPYLLGEKHPLGKRIADSQKSFRVLDIEEVGDKRHTTMFEMLGNWSLGDYFKKEQLNWIYEFLVEQVKIPAERLYATVFDGDKSIGIPKDETSIQILKEIFAKYGIDAKEGERIFCYDVKKNWWSRSGIPQNMPVGEPGGPDSEIFYDTGAELKKHENSLWKNEKCHVNCDCGRFVEIGNNVFMEYKKTLNGFEKLAQQNVDFGGGFERIVMASEGTDNIFLTDLFSNIIFKIEELSGKKYLENSKPFEVVADHIKAATFIMGDSRGISPSNLGQGYIVRRLIRRAIRFGRQLGITQNLWTKEIAKIVAEDYKNVYPEITENLEFIIKNLDAEEEKFAKSLDAGLKQFECLDCKDVITGKDAFLLYQTYGFPIEMTEELSREKGLKIDLEEFSKESQIHQELSRTASAGTFKGGLADSSEATTKLHTTAHLMLAGLRKFLGDSVSQKGSNITSERVRFDFAWKEKMTAEQIKQVEDFVNSAIGKDLPVICKEMNLDQAKEINATGVFEHKYGERVKVYFIGEGEQNISKEICGGPHVEHTGTMGKFKIIKEESSSAGVRRIKAILE